MGCDQGSDHIAIIGPVGKCLTVGRQTCQYFKGCMSITGLRPALSIRRMGLPSASTSAWVFVRSHRNCGSIAGQWSARRESDRCNRIAPLIRPVCAVLVHPDRSTVGHLSDAIANL